MSSVFSKNKEKRGRSSTDDTNSSFVKNVTSRVSGLLPATITKWFSSPSSSSANGSTPTADNTDSSTEDEAPESPVATQPPAKRMRYSSPGSKFSHNLPETSMETSETISTSVLYNTIQPGRNTFRREPHFIATPIQSPIDDTKTERTERDVSYKSPLPVSVLGQSVAPKRKSIFDLKKTESLNACAKTAANTSKDLKQPHFKPSLLGSPFYPGRTMYGGASTSTYINQPNIRQRKVAQVNESKDNEIVNMSYSARQVMDLLENFSSPLSDARRIPVIPRKTVNNSIHHDQTSIPSTSKSLSYKTQELYVPNIASILRLKQRSRLMDTTKAARQIIASHSSTLSSSFQPYTSDTTAKKEEKSYQSVNILEKEPAQTKPTLKLKSRLTRRNRGEEINTENNTAETIQLPPTAVLQIDKDNLPKFTFSTSKNQKTTFTQTPTSPEVTFKSPERPSVNEMFKFSSPVKISLDTHQGDLSLPTFTFGSPERSIDKTESAKMNEVPVISVYRKTDTVLGNGNDWKCSDCWVTNKANADKCVCCGGKQPIKGSSDKISKVESTPGIINLTPLTKIKEPESSKWSCPDCWVSNRDVDDKCVCCGSRNPSKSTVATVPKSSESADKDWKCEDCWISNKSCVDKCAACGGAKPSTKNNASATSLPLNSVTQNVLNKSSNQFSVIVKSQKVGGKWECPTCLVSNTSDNTTCVCCGTDKSGGAKETTKQLFNFNTNPNTSFKFGIDPKAQEANIQKTSEVIPKPAFTKTLEESETNNNVVPKIPTFTFSLPTPKSEDKVDTSKIEGPKQTFTFGIHKPIESSSSIAPFVPKIPEPVKQSILPETEDKEKPQEVPKIEFKLPVQEASKPSTGFFASPMPSVKPFDQPPPSFGSFVNTTSEKKEKEPPATSILPAETKIGKSPMASSFAFSAPGIKPPVNIFASPASTTDPPTGISFGTPLQTAPTTSSPSLSLFQKPETANTPGLSLFQKSESISSTPSAMFQTSGTTTSAPAAQAATAPASAASLFSFGSNTQSVAPAAAPTPDTPSFSFTFGSNVSAENQNSVFKPAFSSTTDNSTNKFSLPSSMGNSLTGNNSLGTGNLLAGNNLGTNNNMSGNPLSGGNDSNVLADLQPGNGMSATPSVFGTPIQKENMWGSNNTGSSNVFGSSGSTNNMPKAAPFTFGSPTPFNSGNSTGGGQPAQGMFGANTQPTQNVFGIPSGNTSQPPPMFSNQSASPSPQMFGAQNQAPAVPMFGSSPAPAFGVNPPIPTFKTSTMPTASTQPPAFNFGSPQQSAGIFGFGQSTPTATPQNTGMYNFGSPAGAPGGPPNPGAGAPQGLQFSMGSAPNTSMRRVRKAVRRNPQR